MKIADAFIRLFVDDKTLKKDATKAGKDAGVSAGNAAGKGLTGGLSKSLKNPALKQGLLQGLGLGAALGGITAVTAGIAVLTDAIGDSIAAASDQREAFSLTDQVFEGNSETMKDWAADAADSFGQSSTEALTFASNFGNAFKNVGFALDEASDKSKVMTELAADLGSAFNAGADEAALALRSGLLGESEPLRRFGVFLDEAKVKAKAVQLGIANLGDVLTDNQKVTARYALIMEQTADSQGMFGRDTESLADAQKALQAQLENVSAAVGTDLLPIMVDLVTFIKEEGVPTLKDFIASLGEVGEILSDVFKSRTDEAKTGVGELNDVLTDMVDNLLDAATFWDGYTLAMDDAAKAQNEASETAREAGRGIGVAESAAADATPVIEELGKQGKETGRKLKVAANEAAIAFRDWRDDVVGYARDIVDKAYQVIEDKAALTAANIESAELRKVIATGKATAEQKARYKELTEEQVRLVVDLAANGVTAGKAVNTAMADLRRKLKTATGEEAKAIRAAIALLNKLTAAAERARIKINTAVALAKLGMGSQGLIGGNWGPTGQASGGPVQAGVPYIVGERHAELFVPDEPGRIVPNVPSTGMSRYGGGDINIPLSITTLPHVAESTGDIVRGMRRAVRMGLAPEIPRRRGTG